MYKGIYIKAITSVLVLLIITFAFHETVNDGSTSKSAPATTNEPGRTVMQPYAVPTAKSSTGILDLLKEVENCRSLGEFNKATQLIRGYLAENKSNIETSGKKQLEFELERNKRIIMDYELDENQLYNTLSSLIKNLSRKEYASWQNEGRFDILYVDGRKHFMDSSKSNLFFRYPDLKKRRIDYKKEDPFAKTVLSHVRKIKSSNTSADGVVRLPHQALMYQSLTLKQGVVPSGKDLRCWLPYPVVFENQDNVKYISSSIPVKSIDSENSNIRSVYFEAKSKGNQVTKFDLKYSYTSYSYYREIDPGTVQTTCSNNNVYSEFTGEEPHVISSKEMVNLSKSITGNEKNPYLKGRKIYNWICDNIKYSYATEYSTVQNLSEYTLDHRYGDCGQEALLFITLCRISGIPARWQSGFATFPGKQFLHDWAEIYVEPYGWLPVDPYMGIYFTSVTEDLTGSERQELHDFYYGNIDFYRMVANKGHCRELRPEKTYFRSDNVDFQRGEIETGDRNLYFNEWTYSFKSE